MCIQLQNDPFSNYSVLFSFQHCVGINWQDSVQISNCKPFSFCSFHLYFTTCNIFLYHLPVTINCSSSNHSIELSMLVLHMKQEFILSFYERNVNYLLWMSHMCFVLCFFNLALFYKLLKHLITTTSYRLCSLYFLYIALIGKKIYVFEQGPS